MINSVVMICPAQYRDQLNAIGEALGYGPDSYNIRLSENGQFPVTHYGTHSWEQPGGQFHSLRLAVQAGITPPGLEPYAVALQSLQIRAVEASVDSIGNWAAALLDAGLKQFSSETE